MSYQKFLEVLAQLEEDQSLFESEIGHELQGIHHENLIRLGGKMCKKLVVLAKLGRSFAESIQPVDFIPKITEAMEEYQHLIMPPKVFGGFCPCLKPARDGPEYDKRFRAVFAKVVSALFVCQAVVIEHSGERLNTDSMHFKDYVTRMKTVHDKLHSLTTKGTEQIRESCRVDLLASVEAVNRFMKLFDVDTQEYADEVQRTLNSVSGQLQSRREGGLDRRSLVSAQSSLQEIMNSAASVSMKKAKESLAAIEALVKNLNDIREAELAAFDDMESRMRESGLTDMLARLKEDSEVVYSDANLKLRDGTKRWTQVRGSSMPRPVAEYKEDIFIPVSGGLSDPITLPSLDPEKLFHGTGRNIKNALVMPGKAVGSVFDVLDSGVECLVVGSKGAISGISSGAKEAFKGAKTAVQPVEKLFGIENADTRHHSAAPKQAVAPPKKGGVTGMLAGASSFLNPLDL